MNSYCLIGSEGATSGPQSPLNSVFKNKQVNIKAHVFPNVTFASPLTALTPCAVALRQSISQKGPHGCEKS